MKLLSTLTILLTPSVAYGALVSYSIEPAATSLTVDTFDGGGDSVTVHFITGSASAATSASCQLFEISGNRCDTNAPVSTTIMDEGTLAPVANTLNVPLLINLAQLPTAPTTVYSFSDATNEVTLSFCSRCYTSHNGMEPGYAEVLITIVLDMGGSISIEAPVQLYSPPSPIETLGAMTVEAVTRVVYMTTTIASAMGSWFSAFLWGRN